MNGVSKLVLTIALMTAIGAWAVTLGSAPGDWIKAVSPQAIGGLLMGVGATLGAAFGVKTTPAP